MLLGFVSFAGGAALLMTVKDYFPRRVCWGRGKSPAFAVVLRHLPLASLLGVRYALRVEPAQALGG